MRKNWVICAFALLLSLPANAQVDKREVRAGNRAFKKDEFRKSEIDYRKAVLKDSLSLAGQYNLASSLYRQEDYDGASKALETVKEVAGQASSADFWYNRGDVALAQKDYATAVDAFRQSLLLRPEDLDAKENYIYAKKMLENQQGGGGGNDQNQDDQQNQDNQQNQDQNQQNQDQNQDNQQNQDQNQQNQDRQNQQNQSEGAISRQQARQMLNAIQAKEKETQDKVKKEKAEALKSRQKEKNW